MDSEIKTLELDWPLVVFSISVESFFLDCSRKYFPTLSLWLFSGFRVGVGRWRVQRLRSWETQDTSLRNPGFLNRDTPGTVIELHLGLIFPSVYTHSCLCPYRAAAEVAAGLEINRPIEFTTILFFCFNLEILKSFTTWRVTFLAL